MLARTTLFSAVALLASVFTASAQTPVPAQPPADANATPPAAQEPTAHVLLTTSMGDIVLELNREKAPISVENFLKYVDEKLYDGTIFHRVMDTFMIQGGGFTPDLKQRSTKRPIKNEWQNGLKNTAGTVAMARTTNPDTATAQFFINVKDNPFLDTPSPRSGGAGYAVFGKVVSGMDVVNKIKAVKVQETRGMDHVPLETVEIKTVKKLTGEEAAKYTQGDTQGEKK